MCAHLFTNSLSEKYFLWGYFLREAQTSRFKSDPKHAISHLWNTLKTEGYIGGDEGNFMLLI